MTHVESSLAQIPPTLAYSASIPVVDPTLESRSRDRLLIALFSAIRESISTLDDLFHFGSGGSESGKCICKPNTVQAVTLDVQIPYISLTRS